MNYTDMIAPRYIMESVPSGTQLDDIISDTVSFQYHDASKGMDKVVIVVRNPYMKYINDPRLRNALRYKVKFGYPSKFSETRTIVVVRASTSYAVGMPVIELTGYDTGRDLAMGARPRNWGSRKSSDIAREIADLYGLRSNVEDSGDERGRHQHRTQPGNCTSFEYLDRLATALGWDFYIADDVLNFHPMEMNERPNHTFTYFRDSRSLLKSFTPEVKAAKAPKTAVSNTSRRGNEASSTEG